MIFLIYVYHALIAMYQSEKKMSMIFVFIWDHTLIELWKIKKTSKTTILLYLYKKNSMNEIEIEDSLCITNLKTLNVLFSEDGGSDAVALYFFYIKNAKIQKTSNVWNTKAFCMKWLWRWEARFWNAKNILKKYDLVDDIKDIDEKTKKVKWRYVKIKYMYKTTTPWNPPPGSNHPMAFGGTNTLYNKDKCFIQKKEILDEIIKEHLPDASENLIEAIKDYNDTRTSKEKIQNLTKRGQKIVLSHIMKTWNNEKEIVDAIQYSIANWYKWVFAPKKTKEEMNKPNKSRSDDQWVEWIQKTKNPITCPIVRPQIREVIGDDEIRVYKLREAKYKHDPTIPYDC